MLLEISILVILWFSLLAYSRKRDKHFPPGPFSWPVIGNFAQVGLHPFKSVMEMRQKYGDIIGIDLGTKRSVFLNEYGLIKEAFSLPAFCGRPKMHHYAELETGDFRGVLFTSGKNWIEQRRFAFSYIQSGLRNEIPFENLIINECNELVSMINKHCGRPMSTENIFSISVINALWTVLTGERYSPDDKDFLKITEHVSNYASSVESQGLPVFFPTFAKLFPKISGYGKIMSNIKPVYKFMQNIIDDHKRTYQVGIQRDFVDCYLEKIKGTTDKKSSFFGKTGEENLLHTIHDMFIAGTETVSITLKWIVLFMAHYPEVQENLSECIVKYLPYGRNPSLADRKNLPYVEAVLLEVLRITAIVPLGVFHETTEDVKFHGYSIPKGTMIISNIYGVCHDRNVWRNPYNFCPERFLNEEGTEVIRHPAFNPFSNGRRVCPGESLARDQLFLFTMSLFRSFKVQFDPKCPLPSMNYVLGSILHPESHTVIFQVRD